MFQGYNGLDGRKGEAGSAGPKVRWMSHDRSNKYVFWCSSPAALSYQPGIYIVHPFAVDELDSIVVFVQIFVLNHLYIIKMSLFELLTWLIPYS